MERVTGTPRRDVLGEVFAAVLFDNDSTLIDSRSAVERSWRTWAQQYGIPLRRLADTHGMPSREIIARVAPELDLDRAAAAFDRVEIENVAGITALPGAVAALAAVGDRAAVVTSAGRALLTARLGAAGIPGLSVQVTVEDAARGKPEPDPYLEGARRLGVDPTNCLVVEDAVAGLKSGRAAGAATLAVATSTTRERLDPYADLVVDDLSRVTFHRGPDGVRLRLLP